MVYLDFHPTQITGGERAEDTDYGLSYIEDSLSLDSASYLRIDTIVYKQYGSVRFTC